MPASAIVEDNAGINTEATVRNTARIVGAPPARILTVRNVYHLPRIKLTYANHGIEAFTVPSEDTVPWSMPFNLARESAALAVISHLFPIHCHFFPVIREVSADHREVF